MSIDPQESTHQPAPSSATNADDGRIDFSGYSLAQLRDFEYSIDRNAFPENFRNLQLALEQRRRDEGTATAATPNLECRFTRRDGLLGWLVAKFNRSPLYGSGSIEIRPDGLSLGGWQRTWLGAPIQAALAIPLSDARNARQDGATVHVDVSRGWLPYRHLQLQFANAADAAQMMTRLPATQTAAFRRRWVELRDFSERLERRSSGAWVTRILVLTNVAVFVAMSAQSRRIGTSLPQDLLTWGANFGPMTAAGQWWRLVTAVFVHAGPLHLLLNMWTLWNVGNLAERLYGRWMYLALYLASGVLGSIASLLWNPSLISVGASGAIFGILGAFLAFLARRDTGVPIAIARAHWLSTSLFLLFNLVNGALQTAIDNAAHVGGLVTGLTLGFIVARPIDAESREDRPHISTATAALVLMVLLAAGLWQARVIGSQLSEPQRYWLTHAWYLSGESVSQRAWQELMWRANAGTISDVDLAERLRKEVLPFWDEADKRLSVEAQSEDEAESDFGYLILEFVRVRLAWVQAAIDAAEDDSSSNRREVEARAQEARDAQAAVERVATRAAFDHRARGLSTSPLVVRIRRWLSSGHTDCVRAPASWRPVVAPGDLRTDGPAMHDALACQAQTLYLRGDFTALDALLERHFKALNDLPDGSSSYDGLTAGLAELFRFGRLSTEVAFAQASDWRRAVSGSVHADLAEAMLLHEFAWGVRGGGYADTVTAQAGQLFEYRTAMALHALVDVEPRAQDHPVSHPQPVRCARSVSRARSPAGDFREGLREVSTVLAPAARKASDADAPLGRLV